MKTFILFVKVILAIALLTIGADNLSKPSNLLVTFGIIEIFLALFLIYSPLKTFIKQI
ncbi:hypothetical protein [Daejeonella lutea]|uniref:Uncharacterized protein n=1 Tax=Daejeonella lutea TaxID=572036 RepID=A0A1T5F892_9SPHI|nr:hypothetical protein [Daejeonella lutea]SKB92392.1 hypothetical protein SAMN05661099_3515 [Daejeonella lutea]